MRFTRTSNERYLAAFNFSSLTDIVMLLLIFFLLTSSFVTTQGLDVVLPEAVQAQPEQRARLNVSMDEDRKITVNDRSATLQTLQTVVSQEIGGDTAKTIVLRIDKTIPYAEVVHVLDIVKAAGGRRFFLATDRTTSD